ncbi:MAG TPA: hypothetical protein VKE74_26695 [Gemmataceae bacterium]|nr:hypothetical protein [Gemmataceae bacterium]
MTRWKYMTQQFVTAGLEKEAVLQRIQGEMTLMGEYGWELVSTNVYHNADIGQEVLILFFKKPMDDPTGPHAAIGASRPK